MCSISWKRFRNTWMIRTVLFWKIFCPGQKNFRKGFAKLKYRWLQSSRLKMSRYSLFCVYSVRINWLWTAIRYALHRESKGTGCLCHWHISCVQWVLVGSVRLKLDITKSVIPFSWKSIVIFFNAQRKAMILIHLWNSQCSFVQFFKFAHL